MKKNKVLLSLAVICLTFLLHALPALAQTESEPPFATYEEMRARLSELFQGQQLAQAAELLEWAMEEFPDHLYANAFNLALIQGRLGNFDAGITALQKALDKGVFFGKWDFENPVWDPYRDHAGFQELRARSGALLLAAEENASMVIEVSLPADYDETRTYPLFIALHGGGENLEEFEPRWHSPTLDSDFVVAYVQSSQVASMTGFHWQDAEKTKREIRAAYEQVVADYSVDEQAVYIGGFSSGGFGSLVVLLDKTIPARGFVLLCPALPEDVSDEMIVQARNRGVRGTLLTTELDNRIEQQKTLVERMTEIGLDARWVVTPNVGHWYPDDLERLLDEALAHVRQ